MPEHIGRPIVLAAFALLALGISCGRAYWFSGGHGAPLSMMGQIRPGMTREQVIGLLGKPSSVNGNKGDSQTWYYTRWTFCMFKVHFTPDDRVVETDHDH